MIDILTMYYRDHYGIVQSGDLYPIQCGRSDAREEEILVMDGDDTGLNISDRNKYWSEITGLYWYWKNCEHADIVGLCSYRRFFNLKNPWRKAFIVHKSEEFSSRYRRDYEQVVSILENHDVILPKRYLYRSSIYQICRRNYRIRDFEILQEVIEDKYPAYITTFNRIFYDNNELLGHNMFIFKRDLFKSYCTWVFDILLETERRTNPTDYPVNQIRLYGYFHELLLDCYVRHHNLREYHSQLLWIDDTHKSVRFDWPLYRLGCRILYFLKKR